MPPSDQLLRDLDATITNVVGSGVVAFALGCEIHFSVEKHPSGDHFEGTCWIRHPDGKTPPRILRSVGVAGAIAQKAYLQGDAEDLTADGLFDALRSGEIRLSENCASAAQGFTLADVDFALGVLQARWSVVENEVRRMSPIILSGNCRHH